MRKILTLLCLMLASPGLAQDKAFSLSAPDVLVDSGFLQFLLPRFSLKTGIRITISETPTDATFGSDGRAVFRDDSQTWHFDAGADPDSDAFAAWLVSDVGRRTIESFAPSGTPLFSTDIATTNETAEVAFTGDTVMGESLSLSQCGRCHVVNESNRMDAIGSTPSFALMRNFDDWEARFVTFYVLKPHGAFTQVPSVTQPFPDNLPPPIAPISVTLDEIDAIVAYVATIKPADLGAPVQSR